MREQCHAFLVSQLPLEAQADAQLAAGHRAAEQLNRDSAATDGTGAS